MIWFNALPKLETVNEMCINTLAQQLDIKFTEVGENYLIATMPVNYKTHQPFGLLHGGASAALAETVGSVASWLVINNTKQTCVGIEINCNHVRPARNGYVVATARPLHIGATIHVWDIKITNEVDKLICVSRLTVSVLNKKAH